MSERRRGFTVSDVATRYRVGTDKVRAWIRSGELRGVNVATKANGRPRYVVDEADLAVFEQGRAAQPKAAATKRRRASQNVIPFF